LFQAGIIESTFKPIKRIFRTDLCDQRTPG
jgi:hypothetical protein